MGSSVLDPKPQLSDIRNELQKSYLSMSAELRKIDNELKLTKELVDKTFMLTVDTRSGLEIRHFEINSNSRKPKTQAKNSENSSKKLKVQTNFCK